jgi:hypothetical protein
MVGTPCAAVAMPAAACDSIVNGVGHGLRRTLAELIAAPAARRSCTKANFVRASYFRRRRKKRVPRRHPCRERCDGQMGGKLRAIDGFE